MSKPVAIVNELWSIVEKRLEVPQLAIVIVSDPKTCAFRHNCVDGLPTLVSALREFADKLERGEGKDLLTVVPTK